jgi:hypothetical protein
MFPSPHFPGFRRLWKPAVATGAAGTAAAIWYEEMILYAEEILALIFLPILASVIYLFNIFAFKSHQPSRKDIQPSGEKK